MRRIGIEYPQRGQMRLIDIGEPPPLQPTQILIRTCYTGVTNGNVREQGMEPLREGAPYDCIIDCSGAPDLLQQIHDMRLLAHGGVIGLVAVRSQTEFPWAMLHGTEASIEVSCHFSLDDLRVLLYFVQQGVIRIEPVVSHVVPIEQAPVIYETLRDRPAELLGVIFDWTQ